MPPNNHQGGGFGIVQHFDYGGSNGYGAGVLQRQPTAVRFPLTIASGSAVSDSLDIRPYGQAFIAVETPSAWSAADITAEVSRDAGTTWLPVYNSGGTLVRVAGIGTATAGLYFFPFEAIPIGCYEYMRFKSLGANAGTTTNQASARTLQAVLVY
jgi:hypothetical protein